MATSNFIKTDLDIDQIIADAIKGDKESLDRLRFGEWFTMVLNQISARMAFSSGLDAEEIRDAIFDAVSEKIQDVKNPNAKSFRAWCKSIARTFCWCEHRHIRVEQNHRDDLAARESIQGSRKSAEGGSIPLRSTDESSPYELYVEKEIAEFCERVRESVHLAVETELANSLPIDIRVVFLWGAGNMTLTQTSEVIDISASTVQRHLVAWQKRILQKPIVHQVLSRDPEDDGNGFSDLIRNAVKTLSRAA